MTAGEATQVLTVEDVPAGARIVAEIPKSLHMPRPKKDNYVVKILRITIHNINHNTHFYVDISSLQQDSSSEQIHREERGKREYIAKG